MAKFLEKAIRLTAKGFDIERRKLMPKNSWLALLGKADRNTVGKFRRLRYYEKAFITRSNNFRSGFYVEIATPEDLQAVIQETTHFAVNGICYAVGEADTFPPSADRFSWMLYGTWVADVYQRSVSN